MSGAYAPALYCIIVTFRRHEAFRRALAFAMSQERRPDLIVVIDNEGSAEVAAIVADAVSRGGTVELVRTGENIGPAGGTAIGMERVLELARDGDWVTRIDDDMDGTSRSIFGRLLEFAASESSKDLRVGAVGAVGARYDWSRGALERISDAELAAGPVDVDYVATNQFPAFSVAAIRAVGVFDRRLFYGSSEVEYGLRLRRAGYRIVADPVLWAMMGRQTASTAGPRLGLVPFNWRRYYSLRNQVHILRTNGHRGTAVRVSLLRGIAKPLVNLVVTPKLAMTHLRWNARAIRDGWKGRLGRTVDPDDLL